MISSFRVRLFVISALIVAATLAAVLALGWSSVLAYQIELLDDRLCLEARRLATQGMPGGDQRRLENDMTNRLRLRSPEQLMLRFEPAQGGAFESALWPAGQDTDSWGWTPAARHPDRPPPRRLRDGLPPKHPPDRPDRPDRPPGVCSLAQLTLHGTQWRAVKFELPLARSFLAADLAATKSELQGMARQTLMIMLPLALVLTALGAWLLSSLTMRPVNRLREAMKSMTPKALDQRLGSHGEDREFKELIAAYNTMLSRLEASFQQASRFSADAAHELKTPLTILQGQIERAIGNADGNAIQSDLTVLLDEVGRLATITRKLLLLSQADAGHMALQLTQVDLSELLQALVQDAHMLAPDQTITSHIPAHLQVQCDAVLLTQLLNNLISNATRYGRPQGWMDVLARSLPTGIEVVFSNATLAIAEADRVQFFDRFYRGDPAHNRHIEGNGLGLGLAREIAKAHGGDLSLLPSQADVVKLKLWLPTR